MPVLLLRKCWFCRDAIPHVKENGDHVNQGQRVGAAEQGDKVSQDGEKVHRLMDRLWYGRGNLDPGCVSHAHGPHCIVVVYVGDSNSTSCSTRQAKACSDRQIWMTGGKMTMDPTRHLSLVLPTR